MPVRRYVGALVAVSLTALTTACAGGRAPIYTLEPTAAPLRYAEESEGSQSVQTPAGPQGGESSTEAEILLDVGAASGVGRRFTAAFASFSATLTGAMGSMPVDGSALVGSEFTGVLAPDGAIVLGDLPKGAAGAFDAGSLAGVLPDLLAPLPPDGSDEAAPWPHRYTLPAGGGLAGEVSYEGEARFAGDTTFEGVPVRRIVSEGRVSVSGSGTPPGAPGEIALSTSGDAVTVYLWDDARGVLVASDAESDTEGTVSAMGFDLPMTVTWERRVRLLP
jgi:hypothetical protein